MRRFIFVIDGEGVENWMPMDLEFGERFHGGVYYGPEFYKERARFELGPWMLLHGGRHFTEG